MAGLSGFVSHGYSLILELAANSGSSRMSRAPSLHLATQLLTSWTCYIFLGILAGGTNKGKVAMWKHVVSKPQKKVAEGQEKWELQSPAVLEGESELCQIQVRCCDVWHISKVQVGYNATHKR